ncbi:MarR family winged helix-turn-helix transcriptional regulator [Frigoribacterium sp. CFBP9030]|uniref:MarR family winged helix-turn-helix transcriptional regulator n=1 Tax=Frigoribacterium sp. CFBP9030 TaxID=3096537 RepID=UPI002A6A528B|nr:MarR family transcriptional regulator [Frigoribacterium sp. CFBP9030]MDY0892159.1 MarR family transcriptional regulator [Frigoribacterium sp. CFBP9030]
MATNRPSALYDATGYWYTSSAEERGVEVLNALRRYRSAESDMRKRTRDSMGMGDTDLAALRFLVRASRRGEDVNAKDLATHLGITSASTSVLIARLVASGHLRRNPHPTDRRGVLLTVTNDSHVEVRSTLSAMHRRMIVTAESMSADEQAVVASFLDSMSEALSIDDHAAEAESPADGTADSSANGPAEHPAQSTAGSHEPTGSENRIR